MGARAWFEGGRARPRAGFALALAALLLAGCVTLSPEQRRTHFAPVFAIEELSAGVIGYQLMNGRWPDTMAEVEAGLAAAHVPPDWVGEVRAVELAERDEAGARYVFRFAGGGTATLRVNLR